MPSLRPVFATQDGARIKPEGGKQLHAAAAAPQASQDVKEEAGAKHKVVLCSSAKSQGRSCLGILHMPKGPESHGLPVIEHIE